MVRCPSCGEVTTPHGYSLSHLPIPSAGPGVCMSMYIRRNQELDAAPNAPEHSTLVADEGDVPLW